MPVLWDGEIETMRKTSHKYDINRPSLDMDINILNIKAVSVLLSNTYATFKAKFMKTLSNSEAELKKIASLIKKAYISL